MVIIPALNEEASIGRVIGELPPAHVDAIVVVDNGSTDQTAHKATAAGARVVREERRGYGAACLRGIEEARRFSPEILVFLDGDLSDYPAQLPRVVGPILKGEADFVIGSRMRGQRGPGAMLPQARWGNRFAGFVMRAGWGAGFTDLGPFRAIRMEALDRLGMQDRDYGWTVEMQLKALEAGLRTAEVPVDYRARIGQSKVTGTVHGTVRASARILRILGGYWLTRGRRRYPPEGLH